MEHLIELIYKLLRFFPRFKTIRPDEAAVQLRFGRVKKVFKGGGRFRFYWPLISEILVVKSVKQIIDLPSQTVTTKDKKTITINGSIKYKISDPEKAILKVHDYDQLLQEVGCNAFREAINGRTADEFVYEFFDCLEEVDESLTKEADLCGIEIEEVYVMDQTISKVLRLINN